MVSSHNVEYSCGAPCPLLGYCERQVFLFYLQRFKKKKKKSIGQLCKRTEAILSWDDVLVQKNLKTTSCSRMKTILRKVLLLGSIAAFHCWLLPRGRITQLVYPFVLTQHTQLCRKVGKSLSQLGVQQWRQEEVLRWPSPDKQEKHGNHCFVSLA